MPKMFRNYRKMEIVELNNKWLKKKTKRLCDECGASCSTKHLHLETLKEICDKCYMKI